MGHGPCRRRSFQTWILRSKIRSSWKPSFARGAEGGFCERTSGDLYKVRGFHCWPWKGNSRPCFGFWELRCVFFPGFGMFFFVYVDWFVWFFPTGLMWGRVEKRKIEAFGRETGETKHHQNRGKTWFYDTWVHRRSQPTEGIPQQNKNPNQLAPSVLFFSLKINRWVSALKKKLLRSRWMAQDFAITSGLLKGWADWFAGPDPYDFFEEKKTRGLLGKRLSYPMEVIFWIFFGAFKHRVLGMIYLYSLLGGGWGEPWVLLSFRDQTLAVGHLAEREKAFPKSEQSWTHWANSPYQILLTRSCFRFFSKRISMYHSSWEVLSLDSPTAEKTLAKPDPQQVGGYYYITCET